MTDLPIRIKLRVSKDEAQDLNRVALWEKESANTVIELGSRFDNNKDLPKNDGRKIFYTLYASGLCGKWGNGDGMSFPDMKIDYEEYTEAMQGADADDVLFVLITNHVLPEIYRVTGTLPEIYVLGSSHNPVRSRDYDENTMPPEWEDIEVNITLDDLRGAAKQVREDITLIKDSTMVNPEDITEPLKVAIVSSAHLSAEVENMFISQELPFQVQRSEDAWSMNVTGERPDTNNPVFKTLNKCWDAAIDQGCRFLCFRPNAPILEGVDTYR
jgi:hypothetical protein